MITVGLPGVAALLASLAGGCRQFGFTRIGEGVYISDSNPTLQRAGQEISTARQQVQGGAAASTPFPELSVEVKTSVGLGPEEFRIVVEEKEIRVEGGGAAGAFYGSLEVARRIREGRPLHSIALARSTPLFPARLLKVGIEPPGISARPAAIDWTAFLDRVAAGRFNTLVVPCGDCFPSLVRLTRFPKSFQDLDQDAATRQKALREILAFAAERNIRLILVPTELRVPQPFLRNYEIPGADAASHESLVRAFHAECIAELLRSYPQLRGVGIARETLSGRVPRDAGDLVRSVFVEGIRASGRGATLFISSEAGGLIEKLNSAGIDVLREVELPLPPDGTSPRPVSSGAGRGGLCARIPLGRLCPSLPSLAASAAFLQAANPMTPSGFTINLFASPVSAGASAYALEREALIASGFGLSAFQPPLEAASWKAMWRELFQGESESLLHAAESVAEVWSELGRFHGGRDWSPVTASESQTPAEAKDAQTREIRDDKPYLSVMELVFSPSGHTTCLEIPELIAMEAGIRPSDASRRSPMDVADALLALCASSLTDPAGRGTADVAAALAGQPGAFAAAAGAEIEAFARLGEFHARRVRAGVLLLRYAAGLGDDAREAAISEMEKAAASWRQAEATFGRLRGSFPGVPAFPDLTPWKSGVEDDLSLARSVRSDPAGFRASPLLADTSWPAGEFDFRSLLGFVDLGVGLLRQPPVEIFAESQIFETESFSGTWPVLSEVAGFSGEGYVSSGAIGERSALPLTLRLRAREAGTVNVWVRALAGGGGEPLSVRVRSGAVDLKPTHASTAGAPRFAWERAGQLRVEAGEVFLQIVDEGTGKEGVDAVVLARDPGWTPPSF